METEKGKVRIFKGKLVVGDEEIVYEEYKDTTKPVNYRTIIFYPEGKNSIVVDFDTNHDVLQKVAENVLREIN